MPDYHMDRMIEEAKEANRIFRCYCMTRLINAQIELLKASPGPAPADVVKGLSDQITEVVKGLLNA